MKSIKYASQNLDKNDIINVIKTLKNDFITQGPKVAEFENKLKKDLVLNIVLLLQVVARLLKLAVKSLNLKKNDHIIVPSNTFVATANAVTLNNLKLIIAPINPNHGGLDEEFFKKTIFMLKQQIKN